MQRNSTQKSPLGCDVVDKIWLHVAGQLEFSVMRSSAAYASTDGTGTIFIGSDDTLDTDDCVAQLVFHELCHALVEGESMLHVIDWGLVNFEARDISREYAALRIQAHLSDPHHLRVAMAPTTEWRPYYEALPKQALDGREEAAGLARDVLSTELYRRWSPVINSGLLRTATFLRDNNTQDHLLP